MIYRMLVVLLGLYTGGDASVQHAAGQGPSKGSQGSSNRMFGRCRRCRVREVNMVFLPCGHMVCCAECGVISSTCDVCHAPIRGSVRTRHVNT
ncbi:death-associated inhibitor of apoptosis 1-like [Haliotis rubra]|uniref:death-associated inhibitor of apoptosis 1-like n=1 Tax=Haliotis rubra TaxID=36100 RepID=UPI001EE52813|nr:death-associated inhibitor of apoptosis 1-like [Haliotis rubra]XP_046548286.1 death-associated inhibitor of apoptosis 1-like [Haliotis rubra]